MRTGNTEPKDRTLGAMPSRTLKDQSGAFWPSCGSTVAAVQAARAGIKARWDAISNGQVSVEGSIFDLEQATESGSSPSPIVIGPAIIPHEVNVIRVGTD
ncbi:MAG: hypothetical protein D6722_04025, partial [Bacteroidetes bacterium]